jgi:hypothetical protein
MPDNLRVASGVVSVTPRMVMSIRKGLHGRAFKRVKTRIIVGCFRVDFFSLKEDNNVQ